MRKLALTLSAALCACAAFADPLANYPAKAPTVVPLKAQAFPLADVRLLDGPFRDAMLRNQTYLLSLDPDRLLHTFRLNVKLPSEARPYGGWEDPKIELRGHSLGHYLSALALMYASTGNDALKKRGDYLVAELAKCQAASPKAGFSPGYLSAFPESFMEKVEARKPVWAPYYTLHKIMAGLLDLHQLCGNAQALDVLERQAAWVKSRLDRLSTPQIQSMLDTEYGGMNDVFANLYAVTANPDHLKLAKAFEHRKIFDPLAAGQDQLNGIHANTQIPKMIGAAREYELTGEASYQKIAANFWENVALRRSYVMGGHSDHEHFFPLDQFGKHLGPETCETCNTYNMLKLTRHLFAWEPSAPLMDFYERALFNHILASQDPQTGMFIYFLSLKPAHFKIYSQPENSFWCCVGTGMENHGKYADSIYLHHAQTLYVNLFIASELNWKSQNLVVRQETKFPEAASTRLTFQCPQPTKAELKIRHPAWAKTLSLTLNGNPVMTKSLPGSYATLNETWKAGDVLEIQFPMELRLETLPGEPGTVAFLHGPIVLAGELGTNDLPNLYIKKQTELSFSPSPAVPVLLCENDALLAHVEPVAGQSLTYRTKNLGRPNDVTLIPLYRLHHQRYSVYWNHYTEASWKAREAAVAAEDAQRRAREALVVDAVFPGESQSETDHQLQGDRTHSGALNLRKWRDASGGGWFSYQLKTLPNLPLTLACTYWGNDGGARTFDILIDGEKLATQTLARNQPGQFFEVAYPLPEKLTRGKSSVTLKFQAHPANYAGGLFALQLLKPAP